VKNPALFYGGIVVALVGIVLGVFFLIPGVNHIIADSNVHIKHAIAFFCLAVVGILAALVSRPRPSATNR
jgi:thiamine transporter ThiT